MFTSIGEHLGSITESFHSPLLNNTFSKDTFHIKSFARKVKMDSLSLQIDLEHFTPTSLTFGANV